MYSLEDALVVAGFLHSFVRHADVVKIANLAQIVNVIAPLIKRGDDLLVQSIFYPLAMFAERRTGTALRLVVDGPRYDGATNGTVAHVDASAILDGERLHLFLTNRSLTDPAPVSLDIADAQARASLRAGAASVACGPCHAVAWQRLQDSAVVVRELG